MGNGIQIEGYREWIAVLKFAWAKKKTRFKKSGPYRDGREILSPLLFD
jgi:hypothetical protein